MSQDSNQQGDAYSNASGRAPVSGKFSIKAIMIFMTVFAAGAASLGHLIRAASSGDPNDIGIFVVTTMIAPMALMIGISWLFWLMSKLQSL